MLTKKLREEFKGVIDGHWRRVYNFCYRMTLDRDRAIGAVGDTFLRAYVGADNLPEGPQRIEAWLLRIANHVLEQQLPRTPEVSFDLLDDTLRSEATRTDVVRSLSDPERDVMLWELKQGCMTSVINCLPLGERLAFVLYVMFEHNEEEAAAALGITTSALKVRLSRGRKKVADYLAPRCEHINPYNPCHCPSRIGVALKQGFVAAPANPLVRIRPSFGRYGFSSSDADAPLRDVTAVYRSLPKLDPPELMAAEVVRELEP